MYSEKKERKVILCVPSALVKIHVTRGSRKSISADAGNGTAVNSMREEIGVPKGKEERKEGRILCK